MRTDQGPSLAFMAAARMSKAALSVLRCTLAKSMACEATSCWRNDARVLHPCSEHGGAFAACHTCVSDCTSGQAGRGAHLPPDFSIL